MSRRHLAALLGCLGTSLIGIDAGAQAPASRTAARPVAPRTTTPSPAPAPRRAPTPAPAPTPPPAPGPRVVNLTPKAPLVPAGAPDLSADPGPDGGPIAAD